MVNLSDELLQTRAANLTFELVGIGTCLTSVMGMFSSDIFIFFPVICFMLSRHTESRRILVVGVLNKLKRTVLLCIWGGKQYLLFHDF